jgi:hypothetical protein
VDEAPAVQSMIRAISRVICEQVDKSSGPTLAGNEPRFILPGSQKAEECPLLIAHLGMGWSDRIFPRGSWAWTMERDLALALSKAWTGKDPEWDRYGLNMLRLAAAKDSGPICLWLVASGMAATEERTAVAAKGIASLSLADFHKDCRVLLRPGYVSRQSAELMIKAIRGLDEKDVRTLAAMFDRKGVRFLAEGMATARRSGKSESDALPDVLEAMWQAGLRDWLKREFERIKGGTPASFGFAGGQAISQIYSLCSYLPTGVLTRALQPGQSIQR